MDLNLFIFKNRNMDAKGIRSGEYVSYDSRACRVEGTFIDTKRDGVYKFIRFNYCGRIELCVTQHGHRHEFCPVTKLPMVWITEDAKFGSRSSSIVPEEKT
jgi:hypothetical protein